MIREKIDIIATLGPGVTTKIKDLLDAGATGFRINCSHLSVEQFHAWFENLDSVFAGINHSVPVWLDLQGAKLRIGELVRPIQVAADQEITFVCNTTQEDERIPFPHKQVYKTIAVDDEISIDDGRVILRVNSVQDNTFTAIAKVGGQINSFKGFNKAHYQDYLQEISTRDLAFINVTHNIPYVGYAISFIQTADELKLVRKYTNDRPVICKVERLRTFSKLVDLALDSDGLWLCRGDLGVEANIYNLFELEKIFIEQMNKIDKPFLIAGQVMEHMVRHAQPSRSEVAHLGFLIENGFHGTVLSDETAIGNNPVQVVEFCHNFFRHIQSLSQSK